MRAAADLLKMLLPMSAAILVAALLYQTDIASVLQYFIMLLGYATLFLSASVLSVRILKSRNNAIMENMLRMLIMVAAAAPGIGLTIFFLSRGVYTGASATADDDFAGDELRYIGYHRAGLCTDDERQRNQKRVNLYKTYGKERKFLFLFICL